MAFHLDDFLPYRLAVAAQQVSRRFARLYAAEAGLTIPEWRVLAHLNHSGSVSVRDIHTRVNLDKSVVSRAATSFSAFTGATTASASPWKTISGTRPAGAGEPPVRMAANAETMSCAAP